MYNQQSSGCPPPPQKKQNHICSVKLKWRNENCREILSINFMGFQHKDFCHQKLMRVLPLIIELIDALLSCGNNIHLYVSRVNPSYRGFPWVQSLNIFVLVSGNPQQKTSAFGGNGKSGRKKQEQCIVWVPLQCGVPLAKRANSYSAAMVMTCKTGESPSNGAPSKVDTHFRTQLNLRHSPSYRGRM